MCLNVICAGTRFQFVSVISQGRGVPSAKAVRFAFRWSWSIWAGMPEIVFMDQGHEFRAEFEEFLTSHGVETPRASLEAAWQAGLPERHGGLWKEAWRRVCQDMQVSGRTEVEEASCCIN